MLVGNCVRVCVCQGNKINTTANNFLAKIELSEKIINVIYIHIILLGII